MQVQIIESEEVTHKNIGRYVYATMKCGKQTMVVSVGSGSVTALVQNASHRAWKGFGKTFRTFDEAFGNYKSAEARAMLDAARTLWNGQEVAA